MRKPIKNVPASVHARLMAYALRHEENFNLTLQRYVAERFLYRLGASPYRQQFILKGALLLPLWGGDLYRATRDVDLTGYADNDPLALIGIITEICAIPCAEDGIVFEPGSVRAEPIRDNTEYRGFRVRLEARLGNAKLPFQVDVGFGDAVEPAPQEEDYPTLLDAPAPRLRVYPREAVIAEKLPWAEHYPLLRLLFGIYSAATRRTVPMTRLTKNAQVLRYFAQRYGARGIPRKRLVKLAYMADVLARQYLGRPITDFEYIKDHYGPNARELPSFTNELVEATLGDEVTERNGEYRSIRLRATGGPSPVDFSLGEAEILGYVTDNYLEMEMEEFVDSVVKTTDPFKQVEREGEPLPMTIVDNAVRDVIGFDLERLAVAERQAAEGDKVTLAQFAHGLRARIAS